MILKGLQQRILDAERRREEADKLKRQRSSIARWWNRGLGYDAPESPGALNPWGMVWERARQEKPARRPSRTTLQDLLTWGQQEEERTTREQWAEFERTQMQQPQGLPSMEERAAWERDRTSNVQPIGRQQGTQPQRTAPSRPTAPPMRSRTYAEARGPLITPQQRAQQEEQASARQWQPQGALEAQEYAFKGLVGEAAGRARRAEYKAFERNLNQQQRTQMRDLRAVLNRYQIKNTDFRRIADAAEQGQAEAADFISMVNDIVQLQADSRAYGKDQEATTRLAAARAGRHASSTSLDTPETQKWMEFGERIKALGGDLQLGIEPDKNWREKLKSIPGLTLKGTLLAIETPLTMEQEAIATRTTPKFQAGLKKIGAPERVARYGGTIMGQAALPASLIPFFAKGGVLARIAKSALAGGALGALQEGPYVRAFEDREPTMRDRLAGAGFGAAGAGALEGVGAGIGAVRR